LVYILLIIYLDCFWWIVVFLSCFQLSQRKLGKASKAPSVKSSKAPKVAKSTKAPKIAKASKAPTVKSTKAPKRV
jgi:hypothetical protein